MLQIVIYENDLMLVFKGLIDSLFLLMRMVIMLLMKIDIEDIFFQGLKLKITTLKLMEEIFMTSQLMIQLSNTTKSENINTAR